MATDWDLIRQMMNTAIDSCERIEKAGYTEQHRHLGVDVNGQPVSLHDFMVSAWTYPENMRYRIVRERHNQGDDAPHVPETARILTAMAAACGELIGTSDAEPIREELQRMLDWYRQHAVPSIERAIA